MIAQTAATAADAPHNNPPDGADCLHITGRVVRPPEVRFGIEPGTLMRPNMPGCSTPSLLSKRARARIVPVAWSSRFSAKSSVPLNTASLRSATRTTTSSPPPPSCRTLPRARASRAGH